MSILDKVKATKSVFSNLSTIQKTIVAVTSLLTVCVTIYGLWSKRLVDEYNRGVQECVVEVQTEENRLLAEQLEAKTVEINALLAQHADNIEAAQEAKDAYYMALLAEREQAIISDYEAKLESQRIKHEADNITDIIGSDAVRLFSEARSQVSKPTYYTYPITTNGRDRDTSTDSGN